MGHEFLLPGPLRGGLGGPAPALRARADRASWSRCRAGRRRNEPPISPGAVAKAWTRCAWYASNPSSRAPQRHVRNARSAMSASAASRASITASSSRTGTGRGSQGWSAGPRPDRSLVVVQGLPQPQARYSPTRLLAARRRRHGPVRGRAVTGKPWTQCEVEATVGAYVEMLAMEQRGQRYTKVDVVRRLPSGAGPLPCRDRGTSSATSAPSWMSLEQPWIDGYKPQSNYQPDLRRTVMRRLDSSNHGSPMRSRRRVQRAYSRAQVRDSRPPTCWWLPPPSGPSTNRRVARRSA